MTVRFETYLYSYLRNGKPVFVPSDRGKRIGFEIKKLIEDAVNFDPIFCHLRRGGHVMALHAHRKHKYFARADISRFFYGVGRNRVARVLHEIGIPHAATYAKWSCVKNPYADPRYSLPYGFVQSPILATLVLMRSGVGLFLRSLPETVTSSVYMDDISLSCDNKTEIDAAFYSLLDMIKASNFKIAEDKTHAPAEQITLFRCNLTYQHTAVRDERRSEFYAIDRSVASASAFERYCDSVAEGNAPAA